MEFIDLNLRPEVMAGVKKMGYVTATKIQEEVIKESSSGKNIIGQSQTGTGKTAAFSISLLQNIDLTKPGIQALILAPTRELVTQIRDEILGLSISMHVRSLPVYGGSPIGKQIDLLRKGQTIVVGTPGRVIDLIERRALNIKDISIFVLDEVDRMLDMGFVEDIDFIWSNAQNVTQAMAFSATITPELKGIVEKYLGVDYTFIKATNSITVDKIDHSFVEIPHIEKYEALKKFISSHSSKRTIVFVQTKRDTENLAIKLENDGLRADCLNGDMRQRERFRALKGFQEGKIDILVVTDVAARGLNVKNIELVVNYDVPSDPESYIHRIGRTGRAGAEGKAIMFVANDEKFAFSNIEKRNKIKIKQIDEHGNEIERVIADKYTQGRGRNSPRGRNFRSGGFSRGGRSGGYGDRGSSSGYSDRNSSSGFSGKGYFSRKAENENSKNPSKPGSELTTRSGRTWGFKQDRKDSGFEPRNGGDRNKSWGDKEKTGRFNKDSRDDRGEKRFTRSDEKFEKSHEKRKNKPNEKRFFGKK